MNISSFKFESKNYGFLFSNPNVSSLFLDEMKSFRSVLSISVDVYNSLDALIEINNTSETLIHFKVLCQTFI